MDDLKASVRLATDFLTTLIEGADGIRLEEVETEQGGWGGWFVTLSYVAVPDGPLADLQVLSPRRLYKRFHVVEGAVRSMTIRDVEDA